MLKRRSVLQNRLPGKSLKKLKKRLKQPGARFSWKPRKKHTAFVPKSSKKAVHDEGSFKEVREGFFKKKKALIEKQRLLNAERKQLTEKKESLMASRKTLNMYMNSKGLSLNACQVYHQMKPENFSLRT